MLADVVTTTPLVAGSAAEGWIVRRPELPPCADHRKRTALGGIGSTPPRYLLLAMMQEEFSAAFKCSPMKRAKLRGFKRNAAVVLGNTSANVQLSARTCTHHSPSHFSLRILPKIVGMVAGSSISMSTSFSDLTIGSVVVLYVWKCGDWMWDWYAARLA